MQRSRTVAALGLTLVLAGGCASSPTDGGGATTPTDSSSPPEGDDTTTTTGDKGRSPSTTSSTSTSSPAPSTSDTSPAPSTTAAPLPAPTFDSLVPFHTIPDFAGFTAEGMARWVQEVPGMEDVRITSTADGTEQPALWLPPQGDGERPLLVILHSWSASYVQHAGIPYAMWARENGWAVIAPEFRGVNDDPRAIGSDLAVQDVVDAIEFAASRQGVDADRVYAVGYSGGGMMSLLLAGRHPDMVTAVAAWGPPHDLIEFYLHSLESGRRYADDIRSGCGGDPTQSEAAREECTWRSPMTHLGAAREHGVAILIGQGISDTLVSPAQGAEAFNQLADPADRLSGDELAAVDRGALPDSMAGSIGDDSFFGEGDPVPVFARRSASVLLVFFDGGHDMVYGATARWFASDPG